MFKEIEPDVFPNFMKELRKNVSSMQRMKCLKDI